MAVNTETITDQSAENVVFIPEWNTYAISTHSPVKAQVSKQKRIPKDSEPEAVGNYKETMFSGHDMGDAHMTSLSLWQHSQDLPKVKPDQISTRRWSGNFMPSQEAISI